MPSLAVNKRANFDYEISEKFEAGLDLLGHEVKSLRDSNVSLKGAFITFRQSTKGKLPEAFLRKCHISLYKKASTVTDYTPERYRKLLLSKKEIQFLVGKKNEQGLTLVPIKIYTRHGFIKLAFGIGKGKKKYDKREDLKKKDLDRSLRSLTKLKHRN